jgi:hypothetical protein
VYPRNQATTKTLAKLGHNYQYTVTTPAVCETAGEETGTCTHDQSHTLTRAITALGHNYVCTQTTEEVETGICTHDQSHTATRPNSSTTFTSIAALEAYLASKPANTAETPYKVALNVNDIANLNTALNNQAGKYVNLNLSGSTITSIGERAFDGCTNLTSVTIPNSVTSIGNSAFYICPRLTSVTIPDSVTYISEYAFSICSSLTSVTIGNSVTRIGGNAFRDCTSLTSVTFQGTITSANLDTTAFYELGDLRDKYLVTGEA